MDSKIFPALTQASIKTPEEIHEALRPFRNFCNQWIVDEYLAQKPGPDRARRTRTVLLLKWRHWFYDGSSGFYDILKNKADMDHLKAHLTDQEFAVLHRHWTEGVSCNRSGQSKGFRKKNHKGADEGRLKLLQDFVKQAQARKSIIFSSGHREVRRILKESESNLIPLSTVDKRWSTGLLQMDVDGLPKKRVVCDGTAGGHRDAPNSAISAMSHQVQQTTTLTEIIMKILRIERDHPCAFIRSAKLDISDAFWRLAYHIDDAGSFAHEYDGLINFNLALVFGGCNCPSAWESHSHAIEALFNRTELKADNPDPSAVSRFVDDFLLNMAISSWVGDPNGLERLTESIRVVVGKDGVNTDKKDPFHSVVNAFGTMIDHEDREVSTPWSKVLKFGLVTEPFRKDPSKRPGLGEVQTMIGLARYIFATAPQLLPILLPRLTAVVSRSSALEWRTGKPSDKAAVFSPALKGETEEQGWYGLRKDLDIVWRLASWRHAKLLHRLLEAALPMEVRMTFPGKETSANVRLFHTDASGRAFFALDDHTGRCIKVVYTELERKFFNNFKDRDGTHISLWELMSASFACALLGVDHTGTILDICEDNQAVCAWLGGTAPRCPKASQLMYILSMSNLLSRNDCRARYVRSEDNVVPDRGSREVTEEEMSAILSEWSDRNGGREPEVIEVPSLLRELGWAGKSFSPSAVSNQVVDPALTLCQLFSYWRGRGQTLGLSEVEFSELEKIFSDHVSGKSAPAVEEFVENTKEKFGPPRPGQAAKS